VELPDPVPLAPGLRDALGPAGESASACAIVWVRLGMHYAVRPMVGGIGLEGVPPQVGRRPAGFLVLSDSAGRPID
jgi:hypothetical protein